jgi:hypothetical protein
VIFRSALRTSTKEAHDRDTTNSSLFGGADNVLGASNVDRLVGLRPELAIDPGTVGDPIASRKRVDQRTLIIINANAKERNSGQATDCLSPGSSIHPAGQYDRFVAARRQRLGEMASNKACPPGDRYSHGSRRKPDTR